MNFNPKIVTDGLIFCLDAADKKSYSGSGATWYDRSGNDLDGTLENSVAFSDANGGCLVLDGVDDYISVGDVGTNSIKTVICWFSMDNVQTNMALFGFGTDSPNTQDVYMWAGDNSGPFGFNHWNGDSWGYLGEDDIKNQGFFQVIAEFDFSNYYNNKLWVNGVSKTLSNQRGSNVQRDQSSNFGIGYNGWNTHNQIWNGNIAAVLVYDRAISAAEVLQNFNAMRGRFGV